MAPANEAVAWFELSAGFAKKFDEPFVMLEGAPKLLAEVAAAKGFDAVPNPEVVVAAGAAFENGFEGAPVVVCVANGFDAVFADAKGLLFTSPLPPTFEPPKPPPPGLLAAGRLVALFGEAKNGGCWDCWKALLIAGAGAPKAGVCCCWAKVEEELNGAPNGETDRLVASVESACAPNAGA